MSPYVWVELHRSLQITLKVFLAKSMHCPSKYKLCFIPSNASISNKTKNPNQNKTKDCILRHWETVNKLICGGKKKKEIDAKTWTYFLRYNVKELIRK